MGKYNFEFDVYHDSTLTYIASLVTQRSCVLEFGSANGRLTQYLKEIKNCKIDIVEIDEESGRDAKEYADCAYLGQEQGNIEKYYWLEQKDKYDYVIFADVLEHLLNPEEVLKRCKAILKKNGQILVSVPNIAHNSIIIDLFKDKFNYTPTGLLDNTHVHFFTRNSFISMANEAGWSVIEERSKNIRVGETEINNSYADVPREVFKELINRDTGNVYQYIFVLANKDEYLTGQVQRKVSLDSCSYYWSEILYEHEGNFDYKKSVSRFVNPHKGKLQIFFDIIENSKKARLNLINCNCVVSQLQVKSIGTEGKGLINFNHNGIEIDDVIYFPTEAPVLEFDLDDKAQSLEIIVDFLQYDFDSGIISILLQKLETIYEQQKKICEEYEKEIFRENKEFEEVISLKNKEFVECCKKYENELFRQRNEFTERCNNYKEELNHLKQEYAEYIAKFESENTVNTNNTGEMS